jgi:uncharacterized protein YjbI with pentapeptide repeats
MNTPYFTDQSYERLKTLDKGIYEQCEFIGCDFMNQDLSGYVFTDCSFNDCNLSMVKLNNTGFKDIKFSTCKLLGLRFDDCNAFGFAVSFDACILNHSSFYKAKLANTRFIRCQLHEVEFTEADLSSVIFDECDLSFSTFDQTNLEKVDFRTAVNFSINPTINRLKNAKFSRDKLAGLLDFFSIVIE